MGDTIVVTISPFSLRPSRPLIGVGAIVAVAGCCFPLIAAKDMPVAVASMATISHAGSTGFIVVLLLAGLGVAPWVLNVTRPYALGLFALAAAMLGFVTTIGVGAVVGFDIVAAQLGAPTGAITLGLGWYAFVLGCVATGFGYAQGVLQTARFESSSKDSQKTALIAGIIMLVIGASYYGYTNLHTSGSVRTSPQVIVPAVSQAADAPAPAPASATMSSSAMRMALVTRFYEYWNAKHLSAAYALLSRGYQAQHPFASWSRSHASNISISADCSDIPGTTKVRVFISSTDPSPNYGSVASSYSGSWELVYESGQWRLNNPQLTQVN